MSGSKKPSLPYGWVVHQSKTFPDRIYYYNTRTRVSSWECPELISTADSSQSQPSIPKPSALADSGIVFADQRREKRKIKLTATPQQSTSVHETLSLKATSPPCVSSSSEIKEPIDSSRSKPSVLDMPRKKIKRPVLSPSADKCDSKSSVRFKPYNVTPPEKDDKLQNNSRKRKAVPKSNTAQATTPLSPVRNGVRGLPTVSGKSQQTPSASNKSQLLNKDLLAATKRQERFSLPVNTQRRSPSRGRSLPTSSYVPTANKSHETFQEATSGDLPDCSTDVEMLDLSHEAPDPSSSKGYFIVIDTNVLMHSLKFVDELKDSPLEGCGPPIIVVPWIVLQELDNIKNRLVKERENERVTRANEAVRYIHGMLTAKHPRFCGQNSWESPRDLEGSLNPSCNDDMILNCCLQLMKKVPREKVVLLSNDKNLCNKAMVHDLQAYSSDTIFQHLRVDFSPVKSAPAFAMSCNITLHNDVNEVDDKLRNEVDRIMMFAKPLLKNCYAEFLEVEMIAAYRGDMWLNVVHRKPPWSLMDILECLNKHWTAVFNFVLEKNKKKCIEKMYDALKTSKGYICDEEQALEFVSNGLSLCKNIASRGMSKAKESVEKLIPLEQQLLCLGKNNAHEGRGGGSDNKNKRLSTQSKSLPPKELTSPCVSLEISTRVKQLFQHVWHILNHLCCTVLDALGWPHKLEYQKPPTLPSREETDKFIPILYPELQTLRKHMLGVVSSKEEKSNDTSIKSFYQQFLRILPSLNVQEPMPVSVTEEEFKGFCTNSENKEVLQAGLKHLNQIFTLVHKSIVGTAK